MMSSCFLLQVVLSALITYVSTLHGVNVLEALKNEKYKMITGGSNILSKNGITADILNSQCVRTSKGYRKSSSNSPTLPKTTSENYGNEEYERTMLAASNWKDRSGEEEARTGQALYVIGRTAERTGPQNFLHFSMGDVFSSRVILPCVRDVLGLVDGIESPPSPSGFMGGSGGTSQATTLSHSLSVPHALHTTMHCATRNQATATATVCVCAWLQLGTLSSSPTSSFCQLVLPYPARNENAYNGQVNDGDNDNKDINSSNNNSSNNNNENMSNDDNNNISSAVVVDVFFRVVYKTGGVKSRERDRERDEDSASVASAESYRENPYTQNDEYRTNSYPEEMKTRRVLQLCVSYNGVLEGPSSSSNNTHTHIHTRDQDNTVTPPNYKDNDNNRSNENHENSKKNGNLEYDLQHNNLQEKNKINLDDRNYRENKSEWNSTVDEIFGRSCADTEEIVLDSGIDGPGSNVLGKNVPRNDDRNNEESEDLPGLDLSPPTLPTPSSIPLTPLPFPLITTPFSSPLQLPLSSPLPSTPTPAAAASQVEQENTKSNIKTVLETDTNTTNKSDMKNSYSDKKKDNFEDSEERGNNKSETIINENLMSQAMAKIAASVVRHSVPDVVIEHDWTERGDWHLICLSLILPVPAPQPPSHPSSHPCPVSNSTSSVPVCAVNPSFSTPQPSFPTLSSNKPLNHSKDNYTHTPIPTLETNLTSIYTPTPTPTPFPQILSPPSSLTLPPTINCWIDGKPKRALKWSALGYRQDVESNTNRPLHCDKDITKSKSRGTTNTGSVSSITGVPVQFKPGCSRTLLPYTVISPWPMRVCVGGLMHEQDAFMIAMKYVRNALCDEISVVNDMVTNTQLRHTKEQEQEELKSQANRDLLFIQSHKVLVGGFAGSIGELCVLDGTPDENYMVMCTKKGPGQKDCFTVLCGATRNTAVSVQNHKECSSTVRILTSLVPSGNVRRDDETGNVSSSASTSASSSSSSSATTTTTATTTSATAIVVTDANDVTEQAVSNEEKVKKETGVEAVQKKEINCDIVLSDPTAPAAVAQSDAIGNNEKDKDSDKDEEKEPKKERRTSEIFQASILVKNFSRQNTGDGMTRARGGSESTLFLRSSSRDCDRDRDKKMIGIGGRSSDELALTHVHVQGGDSKDGEKECFSGNDDGGKSSSIQAPHTPPHASSSSSSSTSFSSSSLRTRILGGGSILSTFFSSPIRQRGRAASPVRYVSTPKKHVPQGIPLESNLTVVPSNKETCKLTGDVQLHLTSTMGDAMTALGGFKLLYPLLVADRTRQVASVRVIASILNKKDMYAQYLHSHTDKVLLYSLQATPGVTSAETIQVLFDLAISLTHPSTSNGNGHSEGEGHGEGDGDGVRDGVREGVNRGPSLISRIGSGTSPGMGLSSMLSSQLSSSKGQGREGREGGGGGRESREERGGGGGGGGDVITSASMLSLLCDISLSSIQNVQIARVTVDWLRGICDDVCRNNEMVMKTLGVTPFLILLSLWGIETTHTHTHTVLEQHTIDSNMKSIEKEGIEKKKEKEKENDNGSDEMSFFASPNFISQSDGYRLQLSCTRFLKQLLTGTSGDQSVPSGTGGGDSPHRSIPTLDTSMGSYTVTGPGPVSQGGMGLGRRKGGEIFPNKNSNSKSTFGVFPSTGARNPTAVTSPATSTGFTVESMVLLFGFIHCMHG